MNEVQKIELQLLLQGIWLYYGHDFRDYLPSYLENQMTQHLQRESLKTISALQEQVLHDPKALERLVAIFSTCTTGFFRDPAFFRSFREKVLPLLRSIPTLRLWQAGCATGEEVYSLAILLQEEGLYERSLIYATDISEAALQQGKMGIYPLPLLLNEEQNYRKAGGQHKLSDYYTIQNDKVIFKPSLRSRVLFARHNLVTDQSFQEFHIVICQNVLIYFNQSLQIRVQKLFYESLEFLSYLGLAHTETVQFTPYESRYRSLDAATKWYQKVA